MAYTFLLLIKLEDRCMLMYIYSWQAEILQFNITVYSVMSL